MHWCTQNLSLFHQTEPVASDFLTFRGPIIPNWLRQFLFHTRAHVAANQDPILRLPDKLNDSPNAPELTAMRQRIEALQQAGYHLNEQPSDAVTVHASPNSAVEGRIGD
jgi:hypothetical protein